MFPKRKRIMTGVFAAAKFIVNRVSISDIYFHAFGISKYIANDFDAKIYLLVVTGYNFISFTEIWNFVSSGQQTS